jgi:hypothetical protein
MWFHCGSGSRGFDPVPCFDEGEDAAAMMPLPGMSSE